VKFHGVRPARGLVALGAVAAVAVGFAAAPARAGIPALELRWSVDGTEYYNDTPPGVDNGNGTYLYDGVLTGGGLMFDYSVLAGPDGRLGLGITTFTNSTPNPVDIVLEAFLPIAPIQGATTVTGSAAFGLTTTPQGGTLASLPDEPAWQASIDGSPVIDLLDPLFITNPGIGSPPVAFESMGPQAGPGDAMDSIGIRVAFSLTPGSAMSMTSVFNVVPAPGSLALLAAGGLVLIRRRRRR
jgi:hypothetical protein